MKDISNIKEHGTKGKNAAPAPFMTSEEAATYLRKSQGAIRNMVHRKQLTAYKVNRRLLFKKVEIDMWLEKSRIGNLYGY